MKSRTKFIKTIKTNNSKEKLKVHNFVKFDHLIGELIDFSKEQNETYNTPSPFEFLNQRNNLYDRIQDNHKD